MHHVFLGKNNALNKQHAFLKFFTSQGNHIAKVYAQVLIFSFASHFSKARLLKILWLMTPYLCFGSATDVATNRMKTKRIKFFYSIKRMYIFPPRQLTETASLEINNSCKIETVAGTLKDQSKLLKPNFRQPETYSSLTPENNWNNIFKFSAVHFWSLREMVPFSINGNQKEK